MKNNLEINSINNQLVIKRALVLILLFFIFAMLNHLKALFVPFTFAGLLYLMLKPIMFFIYKKCKITPFIISLATFVATGLSIAIFVLIVIGSLDMVINYIRDNQGQLNVLFFQAIDFLKEKGLEIDRQRLLAELSPGAILSYLGNITSSFISLASSFVLFGLFYIFFIFSCNYTIYEEEPFFDHNATKKMTSYIKVKSISSFSTGIIVGFILWLMGLELFIPIAVITILLNFIPNIGSIVAVLVPLPIVYLQFGFSTSFIFIVLSIMMIQFLIGNLIEPKFMGNALEMPPVMVILALVFWSSIWGVAGMFLAAPLTAVLILVFAKYETTSYLSELLKGKSLDFTMYQK